MTDPVPALSAAPDRATTRASTATFSDRSAREVLLLRAYESLNADDTQDDHPLWTRADAQWATKVAGETVGTHASPKAFLEARAHAAMQRLAPRDEGVRRALALHGWRWSLLPITLLIGLVLGAIVYDIGTHQRIDLLSLPVWLVVAWNFVVYVALGVAWLRSLGRRGEPAFGWLRNFIGKRFAARVNASERKAPALASFAKSWSRVSWPMTQARAGSVLHVGAAALALGLIAGMYLRGLVLDYRAGWQSTFLEPPRVHALLHAALKPASLAAGVAVPDEAGIAALRVTAGQEASGDAAPWIHLYAATLLIFVVVPRLLLALGSVGRGAWLARRFVLPIDEPYHQRLLQQHGLAATRVRVHAHGSMPGATAALGLQKLIARVFGERAELTLAPLARYGAEDDAALKEADVGYADATRVALFDASATPEREAQGRFVESLRARTGRGALVMMVDESAFAARFGAASDRVRERRAAWQTLAAQLDMPEPVFVNLEALDVDRDVRAIEGALARLNARAVA